MDYSDDQLGKASEILYRVVTDKEVKLAFGQRKRAEIKAALDRGESPNNYRVDWLRESKLKCAQFLQDLAADFNERYPHDACSVMDLLDVLASTHHQFQVAIRRLEEQNKQD